MPRRARKVSASGYYHVLLRGIGRQNIFEEEEDEMRFLETLLRYKEELKFEIHAYCLMGNHVHLLINDENNQLDLIMKKIAGSYAYYFNRKYDRVGHLFQDRFKSEAVEDDRYYLTVLRYIHQNPVKAGISEVDKYKWSSYGEYKDKAVLVDKKFALELMGGIEEFETFVKSETNDIDNCLDIEENNRVTDKKAKEILKEKYGLKNFMEIQNLEIKERNLMLHRLKGEGMSIRQIERLTGLNRGMIQKA